MFGGDAQQSVDTAPNPMEGPNKAQKNGLHKSRTGVTMTRTMAEDPKQADAANSDEEPKAQPPAEASGDSPAPDDGAGTESAEAPPEGGAASAGQEGGDGEAKAKVETFTCANLQEVGKWINYLGDPTILEFAEAVKDPQKKVLVQKDSTLRNSVFENLQKRKAAELPPAFTFKYHRKFKEACKKKVNEKLYACLDPNRFHIAPQIIENTGRDYTKIGDLHFENRELLELFVKLDMEEEPLLPHLGEVAIVTTGIADKFLANFREAEGKNEVLRLAYLAGMLHDIGLRDSYDFLAQDLELARESTHPKEGADFIRSRLKSLSPKLSDIIERHHRLEPVWESTEGKKLNTTDIIIESLTFTEYFFGELRMAYKMNLEAKTPEESVNKAFFNIGQTFGKGFFHPLIFKILGELQKNFQNVLRYGAQIGKLESSCLERNSAVAYPTPRCTQVLCKDKVLDCKWINPASNITIITPTKTMGWIGKAIVPDKYPKCLLSQKLPPIPPELGKQ